MRRFAILMSGCIGLLSLSQEILLVRLVAMIKEGIPQSFALVLCLFLLGIALGSKVGKVICEQKKYDLITSSAFVLLLSAFLDGSIILYRSRWGLESLPYLAYLIIGSALCKSALFPVMHHLGTSEVRQGLGVSVSIVYFSNIIGSTLGPLITGFIILDKLGLQEALTLVAAADLFLAAMCFGQARNKIGLSVAVLLVPMLILWSGHHPILVSNITGGEPKKVIENRHGIIHVTDGGALGDIIFGGNVYDGRINTSLRKNSNGVNRTYVLAAIHPQPKRILVIGLSGGSWTKILSGFPDVERIDVVEINSGYIKLIQQYDEVADILSDPRIHIFIKDGRRWLKQNPGCKYDLIVMNTTYHWRSYLSNLLSLEFFQTLKNHMNTGAILAFNTTGSMDAFKTATVVFPYAFLYENFVYSANHDFRSYKASGFERISNMRWNNQTVFRSDDINDRAVIQSVFAIPFRSFHEIQQSASRQYEVITEQNMITEYKYGRRFF